MIKRRLSDVDCDTWTMSVPYELTCAALVSAAGAQKQNSCILDNGESARRSYVVVGKVDSP